MDLIYTMEFNEALLFLAERNYSYKEISGLLLKSHGEHISANAVGKRLKSMGFFSKRGATLHGENEVKRAIEDVLQELPETVGYRCMTSILRRKGLHIRRDTVMRAMRDLDPDGVEFRRRRRIYRRIYRSIGPNHVWHVDGYDKLKPYGFAIHGCIDGYNYSELLQNPMLNGQMTMLYFDMALLEFFFQYSRRIMWLEVGPSNNDPGIVATNFVLCVARLKGCPLILQTDPGTENVVMGALQCVFRTDAVDCFAGINSFRVVRSVFNQRIEAWWSMLRRRQTHSWIQFLRELESTGLFSRGNTNQMYCLRYALMPLIQRRLDEIVEEWNNHYVSISRMSVCPSGRPNTLYSLCENSGGSNCLQHVSDDDVAWAMSECQTQCRSGSREFDVFAATLFRRNGFRDAYTWQSAIQNYLNMVHACD